jgi:hypothetical protein
MKILVACEKSQIVTKAFRDKGHEAYSNDIQDCCGKNPEWHIKDNTLNLLQENWDIIIAFPPCTDLSNAQAGPRLNKKIMEGKPQKALEFIKKIYDSCDTVCIENPVSGYLNRNWDIKYQQIIEPYFFGHNYKKKTCLWLKNLPPLISTIYCEPQFCYVDGSRTKLKGLHRNSETRNKFHTGIAQAMADQWT